MRGKLLCWLPFAVLALVLVLMMWLVYYAAFLRIFTFLIACVLFPALTFTAVSGIGWLLARKWPQSFRWANYTGYGMSAIVVIAMCYGTFFGWRTLTVKEVDLYFDNLPAQFEGYRIVQLSDLHVGTYGGCTGFVEKVVERANEMKPDLIVFTGDLVNLSSDEIAPYEPVLSRLSASDGVYSILGNHDYCQYGFNKSKKQEEEHLLRLIEAERNMGWNLLIDEHRLIERDSSCIVLAGVGNVSKPPYIHAGDLQKAMDGIPDSVFTILLTHDPNHWRMEVLEQTSVPLTLSGHTHAAQFKIGAFSPAAFSYHQWSGLYEDISHPSPFAAHRYLYVSEGLGGTFAFRLGALPQIVVFTLHCTK